MVDDRYQKLAKTLTSYSVKVETKEKVWIRVIGLPGLTLAREVYKQVLDIGAYPYLDISDDLLSPYFYAHADHAHLREEPEIENFIVNWADCIITIFAEENSRMLAEVEPHKLLLKQKANRKIRTLMLGKRWTLTYVPTSSLAQDAGMSTQAFEDFYFACVLRDWQKEGKRWIKLAQRFTDAALIEVKGIETDLRLSVKGRVFIPDCGEANMPGGEIFTAPLEASVEGKVYFNFPLLRCGKFIRDIRLWFERGKVVKATASENEDFLHKILDTDTGAKRLGEFAIGLNPGITRYMNNVLFDEKIQGTIHMALGEAYEECGGLNKSHIHMDIVKDMNPMGSQVIVDGKAVLVDGKIMI